MTGTPGELPREQRLSLTRQVAAGLLSEAMELRSADFMPGADATPPAVHQALVAARARLDRMEVVLSQAMELRDTAAANSRHLEQAEQDAWDAEAERYQKRGLRQEYEGAQERYAIFRIRTREVREQARTARDIADIAAGTLDRVRMLHRGLDSSRQDLHARLRALAFESSLERT